MTTAADSSGQEAGVHDNSNGDVRGHYIAFEGIEGAGKSTIAERIAARLADSYPDVVHVREPGGTPAGERIRQVLLDIDGELAPWSEALLFSASRAQLAADVTGPALERGAWVVSDRSVYSSLAYQGGGRRLGIEAVEAINRPGLGDVWPDLVFLLKLEAADGLARQSVTDRIGAEPEDFQTRVGEAFELLARLEPDRWVVIDAGLPPAEIEVLVLAEIDHRWPPQ